MGTLIDNNTKKLMLAKRQRELDALFAEQEARKNMRQLKKLKAQTGLEVPEQEMQPWDYITNPQAGMPSQALNTFNPTQTPEDAFNLKDNMQVYGGLPGIGKSLSSGIGKVLGTGTGLGTIAALAPALANLGTGIFGKAERLKPQDYYNPRRNEIASLMRDRRVDINPQLQAILSGEKSALYNLRNVGGSRGEIMGNATAVYNRGMANRSAAYANKQNMDLGYKGEEAQALMNLGAGEQQAKWNVDQWNEQALARKRAMWRTGLSQLGQYSQIKELQGNQLLQDKNRMASLQDMLSSVAPFMEMFKNFQYSGQQQ